MNLKNIPFLALSNSDEVSVQTLIIWIFLTKEMIRVVANPILHVYMFWSDTV